MKNRNEALFYTLKEHFPMNAARHGSLTAIISGFILTSTVNLRRIASTVPGNSLQESKYTRLLNFIAEVEFDYELFAVFVVSCMGIADKSWTLALDRTTWNYGKCPINILVLSIIYKGSAIPLFWELLPTTGNSDTEERKAIMLRFLNQFPAKKIKGLLCDREFVGDDWLEFLSDKKVPFYIRIRKDIIIHCRRGKRLNTSIRCLSHGCKLVVDGLSKVGGAHVNNLSMAAMRLHKADELLIVATNADSQKALDLYAERWGIEVLFGNLKSRGFNLEDTHLKDLSKIKKMMGLLTIATCWAQKTGEWEESKKAIPLKAHGRKAQSIFRRGLDKLREVLYNINDSMDAFYELLALFPPPPTAAFKAMKPLLPSVI